MRVKGFGHRGIGFAGFLGLTPGAGPKPTPNNDRRDAWTINKR